MPNIPTANNNPGDLRGAGGSFNIGSTTPIQGQIALYNDLTAKMTGNSKTGLNGQSTLYEFAQKYDPRGDGNNDPVAYTAKLANQLGVSPDTPIGTLMPHIDQFARAIANNEGYKGPWSGPTDTKIGGELQPSGDPAIGSVQPVPPVSDATANVNNPNIKNPSFGQSVEKVGGGILGALGNFGLGTIKGSEQRLASIGDPIANKISGWLGDSNANAQSAQRQQAFQSNGSTSQNYGVFTGKDVLPAAGAIAGAPVVADSLLGTDSPQIVSKALDTTKGLLRNLIPKSTAGKIIGGMALDKAITSGPAKGLLKYLLGL